MRTIAVILILLAGCATPHSPTPVLPARLANEGTGYVYDELMASPGLAFDPQGKIIRGDRDWCRKALSRTLDLQQALDECEAEKRSLLK